MNRFLVIAGVSPAVYASLVERRDTFVSPDVILIPACIGANSALTGQELAERVATQTYDRMTFRSDVRYAEGTIIALFFSNPPEIAIPFRQWMTFAYTVEIELEGRLEKVSGSKALEFVRACQACLPQSRRAVKAIQDEVQGRDSQTPLLLPLRNFSFNTLCDFILSLPRTLHQVDDHHKKLKSEVGMLSSKLTVKKEMRNTVFVDDRNIHFRAPGKAGARHGSPAMSHPHTKLCFLCGHFRLGAAYHSQFHYDCTKDLGEKLVGEFFDCHAGRAKWSGHPHLNIAPNDFVRA